MLNRVDTLTAPDIERPDTQKPEADSGLPPPVEVVTCSQVFRACVFLCSLVSSYYSFVLLISVCIVLDSHMSSVAESFNCGVLSPAPGGRMSKPQYFLLHTV